MFSATFPPEVEKLAHNVLNNPEEVKIAVSKPADGITQGVYLLQETQKVPLILSLFGDQSYGKTIIFSSSKDKVKEIAEMKMPDLNAASIEAAMSMIAGTARSMGITVED